jgi:hypothetical protein
MHYERIKGAAFWAEPVVRWTDDEGGLLVVAAPGDALQQDIPTLLDMVPKRTLVRVPLRGGVSDEARQSRHRLILRRATDSAELAVRRALKSRIDPNSGAD